MAQIRQVVSESLQATIRRLLPSQQGFTEDLQASNVIMPIIDLTPTAEGSVLDTSLQQSLAFGSQTAFDITNTTTTVASNAGFYRITGVWTFTDGTSIGQTGYLSLSDGLSTKKVWGFRNTGAGSSNRFYNVPMDLIFYLNSGDNATATATLTVVFTGSVRQVADVNGNLTNPSGFTPQ